MTERAGHEPDATCRAIHSNGFTLAAVSDGYRRRPANLGTMQVVRFRPDGALLTLCTSVASAWDLDSDRELERWPLVDEPLAVSPDGERVVLRRCTVEGSHWTDEPAEL